MTEHTDTVAAADAAGGQFAKAFLPGLVLGLVLGLFIGAGLPPFFGEKSDLVPAQPREPQSPEDRHRGEAPEQPVGESPAGQAAPEGGSTETVPVEP